MKKNFSLSLLTLFLMFFSFVIFPVKVFALDYGDGTADDWFNHISQFDYSGYGLAYCEIYQYFDDFGLIIVEEPFHEVEGLMFEYYNTADFEEYFEPELGSDVRIWFRDGEDVLAMLEQLYNFDGYLYWNFEEGYWQVEYYGTTELDYYKQRVEDLENEKGLLEDEIQDLENEIQDLENEIGLLEDEIQDLENEKGLLEDEIQDLENEIQDLENEIQQLEEALDFEYERGYNEGYQIGYSEGLLVENNDIDIIKWFVPLVVIIIVVGIIEPIILSKRRG